MEVIEDIKVEMEASMVIGDISTTNIPKVCEVACTRLAELLKLGLLSNQSRKFDMTR